MECPASSNYVSRHFFTFSTWDYVVFSSLFAISGLTGIYFAYRSRKSVDMEDYFLAGRKMSGVPVSLSLTATAISAATVLGTPAEFYVYGTMYWWMFVSRIIVTIITSQMFIPLFYRLHITSIYEYYERRFNRPVRLLATSLYQIRMMLYGGIIIYAPALALNAVTGFGVWWSVGLIGVLCTFYTSIGGMKAVVWTDAFQFCIMVTGLTAVIVRGSIELGGLGNVWTTAQQGGRIRYNHFEMDPRIRHTFWSVVVGGTILSTSAYGTSQSLVQRYFSCKSEGHAKLAILLSCGGYTVILLLTGLSGLVMYAYYSGCDPLNQGWISAKDQLLPYFVMEILHSYPGLPGIFASSVFSGTMSTVSSAINSLATTTIEDYIKPVKSLSPTRTLFISKILVIVYGVIMVGVAVLASQLGGVLQAVLTINGMIGGPLLGLLTLGALLPWCNSVGAFCGVLTGMGMTAWVYIGSKTYPPSAVQTALLPVCSEYCNSTSNHTSSTWNYTTVATHINATTAPGEEALPAIADLYAVSYLYYPAIGLCVTTIVGLIVSLLTGYQRPSELPAGTIWPVFDHPIFCWLPKRARKALHCGVKHDNIEKAGDIVVSDEKATYKPYGLPEQTEFNDYDKQEKSIDTKL